MHTRTMCVVIVLGFFSEKMRIHELVTEKLQGNQIYIAWCETAKFARGYGVYPQVLTKIVKDYPEKEIFIATNYKNFFKSKRN